MAGYGIELGYKPKLPTERKYPDWHKPVPILVAAKIHGTPFRMPGITNQVSVFLII